MTDDQALHEPEPVAITLPGPSWNGVSAICIDSATEMASLALVRDGMVAAEQTWQAGMRHSRLLAPALRHLAAQCSYTLRETRMLCVCTGPGSFNGIRSGMATAIGLAAGLGIPIYGCGALDLLAFPHADRAPHQRALLPAGRGEYYSALFGSRGGRWRRLTPYTVASLAALAAASPTKCLWCGPISGETACEELSALLGGAKRVVTPAHNPRRASFMVTLALAAAEAGAPGTVEALEPLYVRRPAITTPRAAMAGA